MKIILLTKRLGARGQIDFRKPVVLSASAACILAFTLVVFGAGFTVAHSLDRSEDERVVMLETELVQQETQIARLRRRLAENLDALAMRVGQMQAHVIRLDALGERLTGMADLGDGEFRFDEPPGRGGPETVLEGEESLPLPDFARELERLSGELDDRSGQLAILESLLLTRHLEEEVYPEGRPVDAGWISSYFGRRSDPFTGRNARHEGVDFAGVLGARVNAVAAGVVSYSGKRSGYGNIVEINHGNGYATRYAHNQANLVGVGDKVEKGQQVALMGSTGRATGPNLHFEVLHYGRVVNPLKYISKGSG